MPSDPSPATAASPAPPAEAPSLGARLRAAPWVATTYFAEGLPFVIVRQLSGEFLTSMNATPQQISGTSLYGFAWILKFLWSPLVDRYGTIRGWLLATEGLLALAIAALAWPAGRGDLVGVIGALAVVALLAATHDVAIDGFYLEALEKESQARLSGLRVAAYRGAMFAGKGLLLIAGALQVAGWGKPASWRVVFLASAALLLLLTGVHALLLPRTEKARRAPEAPAPGYVDAFASFVRQPGVGASVAFILLYNVGDSLMFAQSAPFLKSLGLGDLLRGAVGLAGVAASITGSIAGGLLVARRGLRRTLAPIAIGQSLAILLYVALALLRPGTAVVAVVAVLEQLAAGLGGSTFAIFLMRRCAPEHKASHFAIASAMMAIASTLAGYSSGWLVVRLGYPAFFALAFAASLPGVLLTRFVPKE